jgi:hypothetical protein
VSPGFFAALGVPMIAGRDFNDLDRKDSEPVAIVSQSVAQRMFPNREVLNRRLSWSMKKAATLKGAGFHSDREFDVPISGCGTFDRHSRSWWMVGLDQLLLGALRFHVGAADDLQRAPQLGRRGAVLLLQVQHPLVVGPLGFVGATHEPSLP